MRDQLLESVRLGALLLLVASCAPESAAELEPSVIAQGEELFKTYCWGCHRVDHGTPLSLVPLPPLLDQDPFRFGESPEAVYDLIKRGAAVRGGSPLMPPFGGTLRDVQMSALVAYVLSLRSSR